MPISQLASEIHSITGAAIDVEPFPLPRDLFDSFAAVGWARPEFYLNRDIRHGISSFSQIHPDELEDGLLHLQEDLETGKWDRKYGELRHRDRYDVGYCFVKSMFPFQALPGLKD
ncbi:hypothetical protein IQ235_14515 [Oscillatoriales cyanobacterium LEGE 11467]|uniref:Uncharacterized protein n=1 Tax=Zarconia navalis LEGE 11467 TaxID=1828826 RepID=A0A928Z816_9CYAN|nr:hypothetical protein [Zarconia navalis LEGE 11467]